MLLKPAGGPCALARNGPCDPCAPAGFSRIRVNIQVLVITGIIDTGFN